MIVADASIVLHLVAQIEPVDVLEPLIAHEPWLAPSHIDLEIINALRRYVRHEKMTVDRAEEALSNLGDLRLDRYPPEKFRGRIWEMRDNLSPYDAAYVALAELFSTPFYTRDTKLAAVPGHHAKVMVI
jgi:predicted nucleic acid-binding protein